MGRKQSAATPAMDRISDRIDGRLGRVIYVALVVYGTLIVVNAITAPIEFTAIHSLMFVSTLVCFDLMRDRFYFLLVTNTAWLFSFGTYIYSAIHLNAVSEGLKAPILSSLVAGCQHFACLLAAIILASISLVGGKRKNVHKLPDLAPSNESASNLPNLLVFVGFSGYVLNVLVPTSFMLALAEPIKSLFWLGLALHIRRNEKLWPPDVVLLVAVGGVFIVGMLLNSRNQMLLMVLFLAIAHIAFSKRLFNLKIAIALYLGISFFGTLSDATLDLRLHGVRLEAPSEILSKYSERLLSADALISILVPGQRNESTALANSLSASAFSTDFYHGRLGLLERLIPLPQMDIVMGHLPPSIVTNWDGLLNALSAIIPDFGQEKDLIYSDRLTWQLGLRGVGVIGRPMITAVGELYSLGGLSAAFFGMSISMLLLFVEFKLIVLLARDRVVGILVFLPLVVVSLITTTMLSLTGTIFRLAPLTMLVLFIINSLPRSLSPLARIRRMKASDG